MTPTTPIGNERVRTILDTYIASIIQTGVIPVPFVLLVWPSGLGKMNAAQHAAKSLVGEYFHQDCITLFDLSRDMEKDHTIKVSSDDVIKRLDGSEYQDYGIREVNQRLVKSPANTRKVLIIEDIERINDSAANALLKMLEEPLPWRLIIATSSHGESLLPTILSRALLFSFYPVLDNAIDTYINTQESLQWYDRVRLHALAAGRPWRLEEIIALPDALQQLTDAYMAMQKWQNSLQESYKKLLLLSKNGIEKYFLQAYIYAAAQQQKRDDVALAQDTYRLTDYAINTDHILFDFIIRHYALTSA